MPKITYTYTDEVSAWLERSHAAAEAITDDDDREAVLADLATIPPGR